MKLTLLKEETNVSEVNVKDILTFNILDEKHHQVDGNESDDCDVIPEEPLLPTNFVSPLSKCRVVSDETKQMNVFSLTEEEESTIPADMKNYISLAVSFKDLLMSNLPKSIAWYFLHQYLPSDLRVFDLSNISKFETIYKMGELDEYLRKFIAEFNDKKTTNPLYLSFQESIEKIQTRKTTARKFTSYNYQIPAKLKMKDEAIIEKTDISGDDARMNKIPAKLKMKDEAIIEKNDISGDDARMNKRRKLTKPKWSDVDEQSENEEHLKKFKTTDSLPTSYLYQDSSEEQPSVTLMALDTGTAPNNTVQSVTSSSPLSSMSFVTSRSSPARTATCSPTKKKKFQPGIIWIKPDPDAEVSVVADIPKFCKQRSCNGALCQAHKDHQQNTASNTSNNRFNSIYEFSFQKCSTLASHRDSMKDIKEMKARMLAEYSLETILDARSKVEIENQMNLYLFTVVIHDKIDVLDSVKQKQVLDQLRRLDERLSIYILLVIHFDLVFSSEFKPLHAINRVIADVTARDRHDKVVVCQLLEQVYNLVPDQHLIKCRYFLYSDPTSLIAMERILDKRLTSFSLKFTVEILISYIEQNLLMTSCNRSLPGSEDLHNYGVKGDFSKLAAFVQNYEEKCITIPEEYKLVLKEFNSNKLHPDPNMCVTLTEDDFEEKLYDFRAGSHCSLDVSVVILTKVHDTKSLKDIKLTEVTFEFLNSHFNNDSQIILKKKDLNNNIVEQFKMGKVTGKRSVVFCRDTLKGVALHLIDIELQNEGGDRKRANNKFSHYQRSSRSAGDKLTNHYAGKYGIDVEDYNCTDIEEKMQVSLMIFNKMGYLIYCSKQLKETNCIFYDDGDGMFLVKARFVKAFGSYYHKGKRNPCISQKDPE